MRAGRMIVTNHSTKAIDLLLPELERGLFDPSWRIRLSSIQLVGELLFRISGISGKNEVDNDVVEEDEAAYTNNSEAAKKMLEVLGKDKRDRVLSSIYVLRQDSAGQVRTFSLGVWKALVANTPRTVREGLAALSGSSTVDYEDIWLMYVSSVHPHPSAGVSWSGTARDCSTYTCRVRKNKCI